MTRRLLVWRGLEEWLAEACELTLDGDRLQARGVQLGAEPDPYRADYELTTGPEWVTERLLVSCGDRSLDLRRAGDGSWTANGEPQPHVQGASTATWPSRRSRTSCRPGGSRKGRPTT